MRIARKIGAVIEDGAMAVVFGLRISVEVSTDEAEEWRFYVVLLARSSISDVPRDRCCF